MAAFKPRPLYHWSKQPPLPIVYEIWFSHRADLVCEKSWRLPGR